MHTGNRPALPTGLRRFLFRLPIHLYRMRLGWLFGGRLLLLNHIGRASGKQRQVVIEVVQHSPDDGSYVVCSGFGPQAHWYRNLLKTPDVTIQIGLRSIQVRAQPLTSEQGGAFMSRYAQRHPRTARKLVRFMGFASSDTETDYAAIGRELPFVRLVPVDQRGQLPG